MSHRTQMQNRTGRLQQPFRMPSSATVTSTRREKRGTTQTTLGHFFKRVDRIEHSKEPEPVPSTSNMSDTAASPLLPVADDPSALPSPTISPSSSQQLFLSAHSMPTLYASYCVVVLYFSRYCTVRLNFLICFFMYYLFEKYYKHYSIKLYS